MSEIGITPRYPPSYVDGMVNVLLMGAGSGLVASHVITAPMLNDGVGALVVLFNLAYAAINLNPSKRSPIQALLGLVAKAPDPKAWDVFVRQAETVAGAKAETFARAEARKVGGPIAGPILEPLAAKAAREAVQTAAKSFLYPQP